MIEETEEARYGRRSEVRYGLCGLGDTAQAQLLKVKGKKGETLNVKS